MEQLLLALTAAQVNRIAKAYQSGTGVTIKMSKTQLEHNAKVEGEFIGALLPMLETGGRLLLSSVLPMLATGVLSGVGQAAGFTVVNKIAGNGVGGGIVYLKKNEMGCKIRAAGQGLYLSPWQKGSSLGEGMYLKSGWVRSSWFRTSTGPEFAISKYPNIRNDFVTLTNTS